MQIYKYFFIFFNFLILIFIIDVYLLGDMPYTLFVRLNKNTYIYILNFYN